MQTNENTKTILRVLAQDFLAQGSDFFGSRFFGTISCGTRFLVGQVLDQDCLAQGSDFFGSRCLAGVRNRKKDLRSRWGEEGGKT